MMGVAVSALCAIHCTLTPLLFAAKPLLESTVDEGSRHSLLWHGLDYIFLILSLLAVWFSSRNTGYKLIALLLWLAWGLFTVGIFAEQCEFEAGKWLMYFGSISLVITHLQNYRYCRQCIR